MPLLTVNGVALCVEDLGDGTRPLVLVHGLTGFRDDFRAQVPALVALGRTVLYDLRGHGESAPGAPDAYSFAQLVADLEALLEARGIAACDLLGHSMGGMVALRFALARPQRVASLLLMGTAARAPDRMPRAPYAAAAAIARQDGMATLAALLRARAAEEPDRPVAERRLEADWGAAYWEWRRRRLTATDPEAFHALVLELLDQAPLTDRLGAIACPTTVLVGEEDAAFVAPAAELATAIAGARLVSIAGAAHSPQLERPADWLAAVRAHLAWARGG